MRQQWHIDAYVEAWEYATRCHAGQSFDGLTEGEQIPYSNHLAVVVTELMAALPATPGADGDFAVQCALLHDTLEDTPATYTDLLERFGPRVADGVLALSKAPALGSLAAQMADSLARIRRQPREVWMVKLADRIANLYHPAFCWGPERIEEYRQEAVTILEALGAANDQLAARLRHKIAVYGRR
ncbi:HD domain-containing protein [Aquabacterium sp. A7-Y]|uniref:HD domain-containing protein n=1 Tax=Aquabacterium sp. A7-Y TaxID=1349605 RepID=UPI00223CAA52|nr:HD domain-containing protein [Aquabacterium sp. A7-Y]MCW7539782.1 HD domain-containing protein [Aquabacterium sp. A7-Y]